MIADSVPSLDLAFEKAQCFPFYTYDEDGSDRRENITDWALDQFRDHYKDPAISKWDIFYYVYALLHHRATANATPSISNATCRAFPLCPPP